MKHILLAVSLFFLFAVEILHIYFIMPFPGSQRGDTIYFAYWLDRNIAWVRILGILMVGLSLAQTFTHYKKLKRIALVLIIALYGFVFGMFNFRLKADKMFYQPGQKYFAAAALNKVDTNRLVIGVVLNNEAKAYPIEIIGYHHQVRDTVGATPVMVTYCTVCRTGRVFSPIVNGTSATFRLVGMDHFNAMFEDEATKSWWRQATGESIAGPLKGAVLTEIASRQQTLSSWLRQHPDSKILQPDPTYKKDYNDLAGFDNGTVKSSLEKRDSLSWQFKSWVVGVVHDGSSKAYDWNMLTGQRVIQDSLPGLPLMITLEDDTASFHVFSRNVSGNILQFVRHPQNGEIKDAGTNSLWTAQGLCYEGPLKGNQLQAVQGYQEFWHSWKTFHPGTKQYKQ